MVKEGVSNLGEIRVELEGRKNELEAELTELYQEKFTDGQVQDAGDEAVSSTMESLRSSIHGSRKEEYDRILKALEMIEEGTYGICADCELPISVRRLKSFPNATRCVACQERLEEG